VVEEKPGITKGIAKKYDVALTQKPNDYFVQVGAFGKLGRAEMTTKTLRENGFDPYVLESDTKRNTKIYRVRVRFDAQEISPSQAVSRLKGLGYKDCFKVR
jgi:cell division septation protein DedD